MGTVRTIWEGLNWSYLTDILISIIPALICITLHELSHGYVAYKLGDSTAKNAGRLTLNPIKHIDIMGLAMMVFFRFGWAKPVPVDMRRFKNPKTGMAITALAGPAANFVIALVFTLIYGALFLPLLRNGGAFAGFLLDMLFRTVYLSTALAIFNLIPIPPLDGSKVLGALLSDQTYFKLMRYERYGMILLLVVVSTGILGRPLSTATGFVIDRLMLIAQWIVDMQL